MTYDNHTPDVNVTEESLLKRVVIFLEDGDFRRADEYCERVLDINVENGDAYFYKLLACLGLRSKNELSSLEEPFDSEPCYIKLMRFGNEELKAEIESINTVIIKNSEEKKKILSFENALRQMQSRSIPELTQAYRLFVSLGDFENAKALSEDCKSRIEAIYDESYNGLYTEAKSLEQEISNRQYRNSTDTLEKDEYDQYIKDNRRKKVFDYSLLVAVSVVLLGFGAIVFSVSEYFAVTEVTFRTVLRCIFTKIVPGVPLTFLSTIISFRISKKLVKRQRANLLEDVSTAAQRSLEIDEKINNAENELLMLRHEHEEALERLRRLNADYDAFVAEKEQAEALK